MPDKPLKDMSKKEMQEYYQKRFKDQNDRIKENYDRVTATLPLGTKKRIKATGKSVNGLINELVAEYLDKIENAPKEGTPEPQEPTGDIPEWMQL